jgi:uncharacterized repeat protein (TIGR03803 family)
MQGGANGYGSVFYVKLPVGTLTTIHSFVASHACPSELTRTADGSLYGTTAGQTFFPSACFGAGGYASIFRISPQGSFQNLLTFPATGMAPAFLSGPPMVASDGNLYGVSEIGGSGFLQQGTIYELDTGGNLTWSSFLGGSSGASPCCELLQTSNGNLIGVTQGFLDIEFGNEDAVVFSSGSGLPKPPPVILAVLPNHGSVGTVVKLRGDHFLKATQVTFNGTSAPFTVASTNFIFAQVPTGATTGAIVVTTPGGSVTSNQVFTVSP